MRSPSKCLINRGLPNILAYRSGFTLLGFRLYTRSVSFASVCPSRSVAASSVSFEADLARRSWNRNLSVITFFSTAFLINFRHIAANPCPV